MKERAAEEARRRVPAEGQVTVVCAVADPVALAEVATAIQKEHGRSVPLTPAMLPDAMAAARIAGLVYDMELGGRGAVDVVRQVHAARRDWPVWLYYPPVAAVIERVAEVASLRGVWATPQAMGPLHEREIRANIRQLLASVPRVRLLYLLDSILRPLPGDVREYLEVSLAHRDYSAPWVFRVRDVAPSLRCGLRHLERVCQAATGMGPKRLLDRLMLVFLSFKVLAFEIPLRKAAEQAGLSSKAVDHLRHRAFGADARWAELQPDAQFELALIALAQACRVPENMAEEVLQRTIRQRA